MARVLRIINRLNIGGPTYNAAYLTKYLAPEFETLLLAGMHDESEGSSEFIVNKLGLHPTYLPNMYRSLNPLKDRKSYQQIREVIKDFKPDIVHTHAAKAGAVGRLAAHMEDVPVILHTFHGHVFHSYFNRFKTRTFLEIERYLAKKSSRIIAISNIQKEELCNEFRIAPLEKTEVIPLGFDLSKFQDDIPTKRKLFREKYNIKEDEVAIGIIGRLVPIKNHHFFLEGISKLINQTQQKIRVFIIGDGEERESIETHAKALNIDFTTEKSEHHDKVLTFTSWFKEVDIATSGLDIITLTSLNEGTPVSLIEASAAGKPIVTTNVGGIKDVVKSDVNAFIVDKADVEGFTNQLKRLVENNALRDKMGAEGVTHAFQNSSHLHLVENMRNLYNKLLEES